MGALRLEGKFAIVTGAGNGIGAAIAEVLAAAGAGVCCADLDEAAAMATAEAIVAAGGFGFAQAVDVGDGNSAQHAVAAAVARFGALHILVNNAAVFPRKATVVELAEAEWTRALSVNIGGAFHMSRQAIPHIKAAGGGSIIHMASQMARVGSAGDAAYCASKAALLGLAKAMALDHAKDGIRVNTLSPGGIATRQMKIEFGDLETAERDWGRAMHPIRRLGRPEEIARAALFLASEESSFMTGADLLIDGGYTAQ
ncbi:MAG TPA: glucose 1-dehydrogenase [Candidatus Udaeobacter sp.]|nr:glucose 1-dehydrogenase [Candidatus Udaeobacter sp.]